MNFKIGIAFFYHESHTFSPDLTDIEDFKKEGYFIGNEIISAYEGTKTEVGGFIDVLKENGAEIIPLVCAAAIPSGNVTLEAYQTIKNAMLSVINEVGRIDGLLIALHGAMVVEKLTDPESEMLRELRKVLGKDIPIATTLDMHANLSSHMVKYTPLHFGFKTYPHIDMYDQGCKAAEHILHILKTSEEYCASFIKLPLLLPSINMRTAEGPMHDLIELTKIKEKEQDIIVASIFGGFPYSDIPEAGVSVLVTGKSLRKTEQVASYLARKVWENKERFIVKLPKVDEAIQKALAYNGKKPIVLADISDNPLSGGTGDTTELLKRMISQDFPSALFGALYDQESLNKCIIAGEGATVQLELGGKVSPEFGKPIPVTAKVIKLSDGKYRNKGPMNTGLLVNTNGAAHIRVNNLDVLLTGRALSANDPEIFRHIGIEPAERKILGLKVKNHFRSSFEEIVGKIIYVDAPGLASNDISNFVFHNIPSPIWPINRNISFQYELFKSN